MIYSKADFVTLFL